MSFLDLLQTVGDRLGILESRSKATADEPAKVAVKLEEAAKAASDGIPVFFVNLTKGNRLRDLVLCQKSVICSEVVSD